MAAIARESTSPSSSTAALLGLQETLSLAGTKMSDGSSSFFKNIQKTMDKTFQRVEKAFVFVARKPQQEVPPVLSPEEEQLQWALDASMADSHHAFLSVAAAKVEGTAHVLPQQEIASSSSSPSSMTAGDELCAAAQEAVQQLESMEERACCAETALAVVREQEATAVAECDVLRHQLAESEFFIQGLAEQFDRASRKSVGTATACNAPKEAEASGKDEQDNQGIIMQLQSRIAELEGQLFPDACSMPEEPERCEAIAKVIAEAGKFAVTTEEAFVDAPGLENVQTQQCLASDAAAASESKVQPAAHKAATPGFPNGDDAPSIEADGVTNKEQEVAVVNEA
jgi:hypothetical protein